MEFRVIQTYSLRTCHIPGILKVPTLRMQNKEGLFLKVWAAVSWENQRVATFPRQCDSCAGSSFVLFFLSNMQNGSWPET